MTYHFKVAALMLVLSGCSFSQQAKDDNPLLIPPDVITGQLVCSSEIMSNCAGFLTQKDIDLEEK